MKPSFQRNSSLERKLICLDYIDILKIKLEPRSNIGLKITPYFFHRHILFAPRDIVLVRFSRDFISTENRSTYFKSY